MSRPRRPGCIAIKNAIRRIDVALLQRAIRVAEAEGNDYMLTLLKVIGHRIDTRTVSPSDRDTLNDYLGIPEGMMADTKNPGPDIEAASTRSLSSGHGYSPSWRKAFLIFRCP